MADELVKSLAGSIAKADIKRAFGVTGSGFSLRLIEELYQHGVGYVPVHHEASAAIMAGAGGRNGVPTACAITIRGPGFVNLAPGLLANLYEGRACLTLSESLGSQAPEHHRHKRLNQGDMSANLVKAYATCDDDGSSVAWLLEHASNEYPGPTHMDIGPRPERQRRVFIEQLVPVAPETEHVDRVLDRIDGSQRPALVLGSLAARCLPRMDWNSLTLPMVTTAAGKGIVDEKGDWAGGVITGEVKPLSPETGILTHADLIIGVGLRNGEMVKAEPFARPLVLVDVVVEQDSGFNADERLSGIDLSEVLPRLFQALREKRWGDDIVQLHRQDVWRAVTDGGWIPGQAFEVLDRYRGDNVTLVPDTGFFCTLAETVWRARTSQSFCGSSVGRFMGIAIPTAIGLALGEPERIIFCCFGDGGIAPYLGELTIAVEERLPIVFLFFTDGRYGSVASFAPEDPVLSRAYTFADPQWTDVAEAIGYHVVRATNTERLNDCLDAWRREQGPLFVELPFESKGYAETAMMLR